MLDHEKLDVYQCSISIPLHEVQLWNAEQFSMCVTPFK
jgi:hypothetical protein